MPRKNNPLVSENVHIYRKNGASDDLAALGIPRLSGNELASLQLSVASYVESMASELRLMARAAELESLSYFLEMVRVEASIQIAAHAPTDSDGANS